MTEPPRLRLRLLLVLIVSAAGGNAADSSADAILTVASGLFDQQQTETLGLSTAPGTESFTVFAPEDRTDHYSHGVVLMPFKGRLYAQWQSSARDEDAPDTWVAYAVSRDGTSWGAPMELAPARTDSYVSSGGWWTDGDVLVAYLCVWPQRSGEPRAGYTEYVSSRDGIEWSKPERLQTADGGLLDGILEQDPKALPDGRIVNAVHGPPGLIVSPWYSDDPSGVAGWTRGRMDNLPYDGAVSRELEPSWFRRSDGAMVMVFRDQASSYRKLASVSHDRGESWSLPTLTDMPDSRSKQSAGNLPDGQAYLVGNPVYERRRWPLVLTLSADGFHFDRAWLLRAGGDDLQSLRYPGRYKRAGYSYPKSVIWNNHLYVSYATNKEDVQFTRVPLDSLGRN